MNRRHFLPVLTAAAAAPLHAAPKIKAAFYGTRHSHFGGKLKAVAANASYEIAGVCEPDAAAREKNKTSYKWLSEEELLGDPTIRMVAVEMPPATGIPYGRKVIAAGKHLHIEKPPTAELAPFRELIEEARRKKLLVQTGYIWRFHEGFRRAKEAISNGWLGEVYLMRATIHTDINAAGRAELAPYRGGMMFELGSHQIDRMVHLLGRPTDVKSWLKKTSLGKADGLADNTLAVFEYPGAMAVISTSARFPGHSPHRGFEVIGTDGVIWMQPVEPGTKMRVSMREARGPYKQGWQEIDLPPQPRYTGDFIDLARAIETNTPLTYSYDFELTVHETILRASQQI